MAEPWMSTADHAAPATSPAGEWMSTGEQAQPSAASDYLSGVWSRLNPSEIIRNAGTAAQALYEHPLDSLLEVLGHPYMALSRAKDALAAGKPAEALAHINSALDPVGFQTEGSAVKMATPGSRARGAGELTGDLLTAVAGAKLPDVIPAAAKRVVSAAAKAAAPDLAKGTALAGAGVGVPALLPGPSAKFLLGTSPVLAGMKIVGRGLKAGYQAGKAAVSEPPPVITAADLFESAAVAQETRQLEAVAQGTFGKSFAKLAPNEQQTVRTLQQRIANQPLNIPPNNAGTPSPTVSSPPLSEPMAKGPSLSDLIDRELAARRGESDVQPAVGIPGAPESPSLRAPVRPPLMVQPANAPAAPASPDLRAPIRPPLRTPAAPPEAVQPQPAPPSPVAASPAPPQTTPQLDQIAHTLAGKPFAELTPTGQAAVMRLAQGAMLQEVPAAAANGQRLTRAQLQEQLKTLLAPGNESGVIPGPEETAAEVHPAHLANRAALADSAAQFLFGKGVKWADASRADAPSFSRAVSQAIGRGDQEISPATWSQTLAKLKQLEQDSGAPPAPAPARMPRRARKAIAANPQ